MRDLTYRIVDAFDDALCFVEDLILPVLLCAIVIGGFAGIVYLALPSTVLS